MNRRDFVAGSAAAAAGIGLAGPTLAGASEIATVRAICAHMPYKVIFDSRFEACRSFGTGAARLGCPVQSISGDVTALWFDELQPRWARGEGAIVGMTTEISLFCLEQLAWNQWMRVVARVEHRPALDGTVRHRMLLHGSTLRETRAALAGDARWSERLPVPLVKRLSVESFGRPIEAVAVTRHSSRDYLSVPLISWVIAA